MREPEMLLDLEDVVRPQHTALIIVDMQKDFCAEGFQCWKAGRDLEPAQSVIPPLKRLLEAARRHGVLVIHVGFLTLRGHLSDSGPWLAQRRRSTYSSELVALEGTEGVRFIDDLAPIEGEVVVYKHRYSGFTGTNLDLILRSKGIRTTVITGVSTNVCVETTLRDAFELGYYVVLPQDCTASWSETLRQATLENVKHRFGHVCDSMDIVRAWNSSSDQPAEGRKTT